MGTNTIPKQIVDKNGKLTTVYVNPDNAIPEERTALASVPQSAQKSPLSGLEHPTLEVGGVDYEIAPEGLSGAQCPYCEEFVSRENVDSVRFTYGMPCESCGEVIDYDNIVVGVAADCVRFFDSQEVMDSEWYHITTRDDWHEDILEEYSDESAIRLMPMVHLGTEDAALVRATHLKHMAGEYGEVSLIMHVIRLNPNAEIMDTVAEDNNDTAPTNVMSARINREYSSKGVTRYVNAYESAGSVSLLANPTSFEVVESYRID